MSRNILADFRPGCLVAFIVVLCATGCIEQRPLAETKARPTLPLQTLVDLLLQSNPARLTGTATLQNSGPDPVDVGAGSPCTIWLWKITDVDARVMQTLPPIVCTQVLQSRRLDAGTSVHQAFEIALTDGAYRAGSTYRLQASFWRHDLAAQFTAPEN